MARPIASSCRSDHKNGQSNNGTFPRLNTENRMRLRIHFSLFKWLVALLVLGSLLAGAYFINIIAQGEREAEAEGEKVEVRSRAEDHVVKLGSELAERRGVKDE